MLWGKKKEKKGEDSGKNYSEIAENYSEVF